MPSKRAFWNSDGVTVKTELSTSGDLVNKSNTTYLPFTTAGLWTQTTVNAVSFALNSSGQMNVYGTFAGGTQRGNLSTNIYNIIPGKPYRIDVSYARYAGYTGTATKTNSTATVWFRDSAGNTLVSYNSLVDPDTQNGMLSQSYTYTAPANSYYVTIQLSSYATNAAGQAVAGDVFGTTFADAAFTLVDAVVPVFTWRDISCDVMGMQIRHGRSRFTERYDVGTLSLSLLNIDGEYTFATTHPFGLRPGRLVRVTARYKNVDYPMFYGIIDTMTDGYAIDGRQTVVWMVNDVTTVASSTFVPNVTSAKVSKSGARINTLLDLVGYFVRSIDAGQFDQQAITSSGRTVRDEIGVGSDSEGGSTFGDRSGNYVFKDRTWGTTDPYLNQVQAEFLATIFEDDFAPVNAITVNPAAPRLCPNELVTDWSLSRVVNLVTLGNRGSASATFSDQTSIVAIGPQSYQRLDFINQLSSTLSTRASDYLTGNNLPTLRLNAIGYRANGMDAFGWQFTLGVFLGWLVRASYQHPTDGWGWQIVTHVQSIVHTITPRDWSVRMELDQPYSFDHYPVGTGQYRWDETDALWDVGLWGGAPYVGAKWSAGDKWSNPDDKWGV